MSIIAGLDFLMLGNQQRTPTTSVKELRPTAELPIYGFNGYMLSGHPIKDLGFVKYEASCDPNPGKLPSNADPLPVASENNTTLIVVLSIIGVVVLAALIVPLCIYCFGTTVSTNQVVAAAVVMAVTEEGKEEADVKAGDLELNNSIQIEDSSRVPLQEERLERLQVIATSPIRNRPSSTKHDRGESALTIQKSDTMSEGNRRLVNALAGIEADDSDLGEYG